MSDHEFDPFVNEIARELKRPVHLDARFDDRVMAALAPSAGLSPSPSVFAISTRRASRPWYSRPFSFSVSPLHAFAAAAVLGAIALGTVKLRSGTDTPLAASPDTSLRLEPASNVTAAASGDLVYQQFIIMVPGAQSVSLIGDFNDWDPARLPMTQVSDDGAWSVIVPLAAGRYEFQYEIDGARRITDPSRQQTSSAFGSANSVVHVEAAR